MPSIELMEGEEKQKEKQKEIEREEAYFVI